MKSSNNPLEANIGHVNGAWAHGCDAQAVDDQFPYKKKWDCSYQLLVGV